MIVLIENPKDIYLNLPPLLFAILYDKITTMSAPTPESPWTISRLSPSLSSLAPVYLSPTASIAFSNLPPLSQIKIALYRRVLTYPLYRNLSLADKAWTETIRCLTMGKRAIIRLLILARTMFMDGGDWSVYSRIIWEDYIIWCQGSKDRVLTVLAEEMEKVKVTSDGLGFGLDDVEGME
jgi:protein SHQ1